METARTKIISAGHICLDITPAFPASAHRSTGDLFLPGQLISVGRAAVHLGGSVSNTGIAMKLLGGDVELMSTVGDDAFGRMVVSELSRYGIEGGIHISPEAETSYSVILAPPGIDRIFLHHSGANDTFDAGQINWDTVKQAGLFHFGYPTLMRRMYENQGEGLFRLLTAVKEAGCATSVDMAMVEESTEAGQTDWSAILERCIPYIDFFVPSAEELCMMLDRQRYHEWQERARGADITSILDIERDIRPLADELLYFGAKVVLIKCGAPGLYLRTAGHERLLSVGGGMGERLSHSWENLEYFEKSYVPDRLLSGTGAGDTTIAAFLTAVLKGYSWKDCLHLAAATGAMCVSTYDALSGLKSFPELEKRIHAGWKKAGE